MRFAARDPHFWCADAHGSNSLSRKSRSVVIFGRFVAAVGVPCPSSASVRISRALVRRPPESEHRVARLQRDPLAAAPLHDERLDAGRLHAQQQALDLGIVDLVRRVERPSGLDVANG